MNIDEKPRYVNPGEVWENKYSDNEYAKVVVKRLCLHSEGYWWIEVLCLDGSIGGINYATFRLGYSRLS